MAPSVPTWRLRAALIVCALLAPALVTAWFVRNVPKLGWQLDDGIYYVTAQSLAQGRGYRIPSLPGAPYQTKYPPAYPALLAIGCSLAPFPRDLPAVLLLNWLALPLYGFCAWRLAGVAGLSTPWRIVAVLGTLSAFESLLDSVNLISDLWFSALALAAILLAGRMLDHANARTIAAAAVAADLAYLTRTAGIVLPAAVLLVLIVYRRFRPALWYALAIVPAIACWSSWAAARVPASLPDYNDVYTFSYNAPLRAETNWRLLPVRVLEKLLEGAHSLATLVQPFFHAGSLVVVVVLILLGFCIAGYRRALPSRTLYIAAVFAVVYLALILVWPWYFYRRLWLPVFPLLVIGLMLALRRAGVPAVVPGTFFAIVYIISAVQVTNLMAQKADAAYLPAYDWVRTHTSPTDTFVADPDTVFWLHTGRAAETIYVSVREDRSLAAVRERLNDVAGFARRRGHRYIFFTPGFLAGAWETLGRTPDSRGLDSSPGVEVAYRAPPVIVYRVR